jgi:hypothetical protein
MVTFWAPGGRTARTENRRHYYIAKIDNFDVLGPKLMSDFDPAEWKFFLNYSRPNLSDQNMTIINVENGGSKLIKFNIENDAKF